MKFVGYITREEGLDNYLTFTKRTKGMRSRGKQRVNYLKGLREWITEQGQRNINGLKVT